MRKYTKKATRQCRDVESGKCYCFVLGEVLAKKRVSGAVYEAVKQLKERCPLHVSGECLVCREKLDDGCVDLFQAAGNPGVRSL